MNKRELVCIVCPNGCQLVVDIEEGLELAVKDISGHTCDKGPEWAEQEITNPMRSISSNVAVDGGDFTLVSVRTDSSIPLGKIFQVMDEIKSLRVKAPVQIGEKLIENPAGTSCNIIATRHVNSADIRKK
jgi:CxxC motif-containing protein